MTLSEGIILVVLAGTIHLIVADMVRRCHQQAVHFENKYDAKSLECESVRKDYWELHRQWKLQQQWIDEHSHCCEQVDSEDEETDFERYEPGEN